MSCPSFPKQDRRVSDRILYPGNTPSGLPPGVPAHRGPDVPSPEQMALLRAQGKASAQRYRELFNKRCC